MQFLKVLLVKYLITGFHALLITLKIIKLMTKKHLFSFRHILKAIVFCCVAILIYSCEKDTVSSTANNSIQDIESLKMEFMGDTVSLEQAENIAMLFNVSRKTKTESNDNIKIGNSFAIEDNTNSSTLYVINFDGSNGYVIVGSTKKIRSYISI